MLCSVVFTYVCLPGVVADPSSKEEPPAVYTVKAGETIADLAKRFLGSPRFAPELLALNQIENPAEIGEGYLLAIPGEERSEATTILLAAEEKMLEAADAQAPQFAAKEYQQAEAMFRWSRQSLMEASYSKAARQGSLCIEQAKRAIEAAQANASVDKSTTVTAVFGKADISCDGGDSWEKVEEGRTLDKDCRLRTDERSRVEITLADGSKTHLSESSTINISFFEEDIRSGRTRARLELMLGEMLGEIEKRRTEDSEFEVISGDAAIAIRGTVFRLNRDEEGTTRNMVLEGVVLSSAGGKQVEVEEGFGNEIRKKPLKPLKLLPPPKVAYPPARTFATAAQVIPFAWEKVSAPGKNAYDLEIAEDPAFHRIVQNVRSHETRQASIPLAEGTYYWRISSVDKRGMEGAWDGHGTLTIRPKELGVRLTTEATAVEDFKQTRVPKGAVYRVQPAVEDSTVTAVEYRINDGEVLSYEDGIELAEDGSFTLRVRGKSPDGSTGPEETLHLLVDGTPPDVNVLLEDPAIEGRDTFRVARLDVTDASEVTSIEVSVDGAPLKPYAKQISLDPYTSHTICYRARDEFGNSTGLRYVGVNGAYPHAEQNVTPSE